MTPLNSLSEFHPDGIVKKGIPLDRQGPGSGIYASLRQAEVHGWTRTMLKAVISNQ